MPARGWGNQPAWIAPTLLGTWVNLGANGYPVGYYKDAWGYVHLRGAVSTGVAGTTVFTLPAGFRPTSPINFRLPCTPSADTDALQINTNGNVTPNAVLGNAYLYFDGISFFADA